MVTWISHRGYTATAVENTHEAFRAAFKMGFRHFETDLRLTADHEIVLYHDHSLKRLMNLDLQVEEMTRKQLSDLRYDDQSRLMFFDQFIDEFAGFHWTLDIKPEKTPRLVLQLIRWIESHHGKEWFKDHGQFLTWNPQHEKILRDYLGGGRFYANRRECWVAGLSTLCRLGKFSQIKSGRTYAITPRLGPFPLFKPSFVNAYHEASARVIAFLPETTELTRAAINIGVDEILTNGVPI
jgi:glycerophosphoryl diester phosphodiesterase